MISSSSNGTAEPAGLDWTVELWEGGQWTRVLARAENVALARGAFDRATSETSRSLT
jgi:hypothetical protein